VDVLEVSRGVLVRCLRPDRETAGGVVEACAEATSVSAEDTLKRVAIGLAAEARRTVPVAFITRDKHVFKAGGARICTTTSRTMARRICNALNQYVPGERGY